MVPIKIRFAFTGFILSFKTSLITNTMHMEPITGARGGGGGLVFGKKHNTCIETLVYNWGPYKWRGGGELIIVCYASYFSQAP